MTASLFTQSILQSILEILPGLLDEPLESRVETINAIRLELSKYSPFASEPDSSVMLHLVMESAIARKRKVAVMFIDFEAQYSETIKHVTEMFDMYRDHIEPHWITVPMLLRNAVTNYEPRWTCWDEEKRDIWIREKPANTKRVEDYPFCLPGMRMCKVLLRNDYWCKGLGQTQPKSEAFQKYKAIKASRKAEIA